MNEHEIERIASGIHGFRPDWPIASLLTLIRTKLGNKARRDVAVALAWVACESDTKTPARVLENGPWWQAVGGFTNGSTAERRTLPPDNQCAECGCAESVCNQRLAANGEEWGHTFWPVSKGTRSPGLSPEEMATRVAEARRAIELALPPRQTSWMERRPDSRCGTDCIRGAGHTGPHEQPTRVPADATPINEEWSA